MIDKNGKLFGKINIIDLIVVLIFIAVVAFVAMKVLGSQDSGTNLSQVRISFFAEETPDYVTEALEEGTSVLDSTEKVTIGTVESFEIGEPLGYFTDTDGEVQAVERNGYKSATINVLATAELGEHGATIDGTLYGVGHTLTIYAGEAKLYLKVRSIEPVA